MRPHTAIDAVADAYTDTLIKLNPSFATVLGVPGHETEFQDFSPAGTAEFAAAARETLAALAGLEPEDDVDAVTLDAMRERLGLQLEIHASGWDAAELNNIESPAQNIRSIFDLMPTDTEEHWEHIAGRAQSVPGAIDGYIESLRSAKEQGRVSAARQVSIVIEQATQVRSRGRLLRENGRGRKDQGRPAFRLTCRQSSTAALPRPAPPTPGWLTSCRTELLPAAPDKDAVGRDRYALASRAFLGAAVDLDETYAWGVQELDRLIAEQERVAAEIQPGRIGRGSQGDPQQRSGTASSRAPTPSRPGCRTSRTRPWRISPACTSRFRTS